MPTFYLTLLAWLHSTKARHLALFAIGFLFTYCGYFFWQIIAAYVCFFTLGSGAGHDDEGLLVSAGFLFVHIGALTWLYWERTLYATWWAWILNVAVSIGLFAYYVFLPWYSTPLPPTYQQFSFVRGSQYYRIILEKPENHFDISDFTNQRNGTTTSILMSDYQVRHDTIFLQEWHGPRQCFIYHRTLVGFDNSTVPIPLILEIDITPLSLRKRE